MKTLAKKALKKSAELAKQTGKQVASEIAEIPKQSTKDLTGVNIASGKKESPIVEAMQQGEESNQEELEKKRIEGIERVKALEQEMARLRKQREEERTKVESPEETIKPGEPVSLPPSAPSRGLGKPGDIKTPEIRKSKH